MLQRYDLKCQLQFVILSLEHWKNWYFNCNKNFLWRNKYWSSIFSDYFQVRYFQIFSISRKLLHLETSFFQQKIEKILTKKWWRKIFSTRNLEVRYFQITTEFARPASASLRPGDTASFEEMSQQWRAVGNTVSNLANPRFEHQTSRFIETNDFPLDEILAREP